MTKSNENLTKERKSFKEVLVENKGKIIVGGLATIGAVVGGTFMLNQLKFDISFLKMGFMQAEINDSASQALKDFNEELIVVKAITLEGALEQAIETIKKKIQYRVTKIDGCIKEGSPQALLSKEIYEKELEYFKDKLALFEEEWNKMIH